jgi:hypothetical protein
VGDGTSEQAAGATLPAPAASERVELARLALAQALALDGVVRADAGPLGTRITLDGREPLAGVTAAALADGRYGVTLHLVSRVVPLRPLADRIRARIKRGASRAGLEDALGPIDIFFEDLAELPGKVV